ncbi:adenylosuccinate synthetase, partial [Burkholderia ubonensis]
FDGWAGTVAGKRRLGDLPQAARRFVERVEAIAGVPVSLITTGPERDDTIVLRSPFESSAHA